MFVHANLTATGFGTSGLETMIVLPAMTALAEVNFLSGPAMIKSVSGGSLAMRPEAVWSKNSLILFFSIFMDLYNGPE